MIGFFGGAFDPVHDGHLQLSAWVRDEFSMTALYLLPAASSPSKKFYFDTNTRISMLKCALAEFPELSLDLRDIKRGAPTFTIDSLRDIRPEFGDTPIAFIIGADGFAAFENWKNPGDFHRLCHLIILRRANVVLDNCPLFGFEKTTDKNALGRQNSGLIYFAESPEIPFSSTMLREKIRRRENLAGQLPKSVVKMIRQYESEKTD